MRMKGFRNDGSKNSIIFELVHLSSEKLYFIREEVKMKII